MSPPIFSEEGPHLYDEAYAVYGQYARPGPYRTRLNPQQERRFRQWVQTEGVPFNFRAGRTDYDMRGYWRANRRNVAALDYEQGEHFPDRWKTPYDTTFSRESVYATPDNPFVWKGNVLVNRLTGQVMYAPPNTRKGV